jgi:signal transduction histidine kinase
MIFILSLTIAIMISVVWASWRLLHFRLLDIVPAAHQAVIDGLSEGVIILDAQNRIVDINPAAQRIIGLDTSKSQLSNWSEFIRLYPHANEAQAEIVSGESQVQRYFEMRLSPLYDQQHCFRGRLMVLREILEGQQTEEALAFARNQLLEANCLKLELLPRLSHELRTPLSVILGFAEMLQLDVYGPLSDEQKLAVAEIIQNTLHLVDRVNEALDEVQFDADNFSPNSRDFAPIETLIRPPAT